MILSSVICFQRFIENELIADTSLLIQASRLTEDLSCLENIVYKTRS